MRRIRNACAAALVALPLAASALAGQVSLPGDNTAYGTTAGEFLLLGAGARGSALGGAYAALATDVTALYYNPAGVAQLDRPGVLVSTYSYIGDTRYSWAGLAFPMAGGVRSVGFQVGNFGFRDQPVYTAENPDGDGTKYGVAQTFIGLTYAQNFSDRFSAGVTAKVISDQLGKAPASGWAVDFGTSFHATAAGRPLRASFVIQNLGTALHHTGSALDVRVPRPPVPGQVDVPQEDQPAKLDTKEWGLPVQFRVGVVLDIVSMEQAQVRLLSEFSQPTNSRAGFAVGGEFTLADLGKSGFWLAGRGSWSYQADNDMGDLGGAGFDTGLTGKEKADGLAAGFGVGYTRGNFGLGFDYAYRSLGVLGGTNMVSVSLNW
jgi:hypothetical protein